MTLGVMPVTGLPLPFVSYGGSSMLLCWVVLGILLAINSRWFEY
jgi:rod shape determining protein RodA